MDQDSAKKMVETIVRQRMKKVDPHVRDTLLSMFIADLPVHDQSYIERRLREVVEEMFKKIDFNSPEIVEVKKDFLKKCFDSLMDARPEPKKFKKIPIDLTEERDKRCEPIVFEIMNRLLDKDLVFSEEDYFKEAMEEMNSNMLRLLVFGFIESFFNNMDISSEINMKEANRILWEGKDPEQRTMQQVDRVLKSKK